ncbi:MAG: ABC transporter substrate-binding protein [Burkholderiales bacterium]
MVSDPVGIGLITSLARPGGNVTGVTSLTADLAPKQLEFLVAMVAAKVPKVTRVAVLMNPGTASHFIRLKNTEAAAKKLGVTIVPVEAQDAAQIDAAFAKMREQNAGALFVFLSPLFQQRSGQIAELAAKYRLPSMTAASVYPEAGCLMSYGTNLYEQFRRGAYFVDRILKGAKPADLPFEQPTKFELVINGRTAKALGLKIPHALLSSAERGIE